MAVATLTTTVTTSRLTDSGYMFRGNIAVSVNPDTYATGGIPFNLNQSNVKASRTPENVVVQGSAGYIYSYVYGSDNSNGLLKIFQQSAATSPLTEIPAAAIPAAVSSDTIKITANYKGML